MKISLIVATLGRKKELFEMLSSIRTSYFDLESIEVIIIDQNDKNFIMSEILEFDGLNVKYIHSELRGLSLNRNIGIRQSCGEIICFPDDDCLFYKDTLSNVVSCFENHNVDFCMGRIYDRENKLDIIKKWPQNRHKVRRFNSYFLNSSITLFVKRKGIIEFDEDLGVGAKYGSCEDADYIYRLLKDGNIGIYSPSIEIWHPSPDFNDIPLEKVENYASGFRHYVSKDTDIVKISLFFMLMSKKFVQFLFLKHRFKKGYFSAFFRGVF